MFPAPDVSEGADSCAFKRREFGDGVTAAAATGRGGEGDGGVGNGCSRVVRNDSRLCVG